MKKQTKLIPNDQVMKELNNIIRRAKPYHRGLNDDLRPTILKLVAKHIALEHRDNALQILNKCTDITIQEFLFHGLRNDGNLTCLCLDFAVNKRSGKRIVNKSFGYIEKP